MNQVYLRTLNAEQRAAVCAPVGPVLVKAGAGSGKTRVLTTRIAHLIAEYHAVPSEIVAVTFTNKAAEELRQRLRDLLGKSGKGVIAGTFHALCTRILRKYIDQVKLKYTSNFTIYASDEQLQLVQQALDTWTGRVPQILEPQDVLRFISRFKSNMQLPSVAQRMAQDPVTQYAAGLYRSYQRSLEQSNAVDFDDLIGLTYKLLFENPDILDELQATWKHILVDEYQDTDASQYALLELLTRPVGNAVRSFFAVGDAQQSIYGFRNADYTIITRFTRDFPSAVMLELPTNYRSRQEILDAAYAVMRHSRAVPPMILKAHRASPPIPALVINEAQDERVEASKIAQAIQELIAQGRKPSDIAILYRSRHMSRGLETALRGVRIPYALKNQRGFYDRRVIRDALAYLRTVANPQDSLSLNRIINVPSRGLGPATLSHLTNWAAQNSIPLGEAILKSAAWSELGERVQASGRLVSSMIRKWRTLAAGTYTPDSLLQLIMQESGYLKMVNEWNEADQQDAICHLQELEVAAAEHTSVSSFLQEVALLTNVDNKDEREAVQLMTIHGSKGLEWPIVFIAGLEEGTLPHERSIADSNGVEEERRLCYVAVTRAGEQLLLSHAAKRARQNRRPSRFLEDILAYGRERAQARMN